MLQFYSRGEHVYIIIYVGEIEQKNIEFYKKHQ